VTRASRDASVDGHDVRGGDVIGLRDDVLVITGGSPEDAVVRMLKDAYAGQEIATIFTGPNASEEATNSLLERLQAELPQVEPEVHPGGPDLYDYLVTLE
ncbi:MAG TPA: kinase, partial [Deinococcales bacterium]|nr:kinase [Deinococcales bacterium]